ncbi:hypothetical protein IV203_022230 [Nitzschia inconspicua]|uniref:Uncharacterized protein n=1 Tax=Nitzschia inconspicua TaxID=303405 RepID=A0A9K3KI89_9STRA|nr:hypothetical protein IV203_022230 [Nitzschia inconspicua]
MNEYLNLQLLQEQCQLQQKFVPPVGRRASLLACMDDEGKIDPIRYIEYSRLKRANFLYHMNNLFPGGGAAHLIPSSSTTTPSPLTMLAMSHRGSMLGSNTMRNNSLLGSGLPLSLPGAPYNNMKMDFSRTGVYSPRMTKALSDMDTSNSSMTSLAPSLHISPSLPFATYMAPSMVVAPKQQEQREDKLHLRQDEYDAAEALLFGIGRAGRSNKNAATSKDTEDVENINTTKNKVKTTPKKKQRKTKMSLPIKKIPKKKTSKKSKKTGGLDDVVKNE